MITWVAKHRKHPRKTRAHSSRGKSMNLLDWVLAAAFVGLLTFAFWLILPDYGWAIGIVLGGYLIYRNYRRA